MRGTDIPLGTVFGRLAVICKSDRTLKGTRCYWRCRCECGTEKEINGYKLLGGGTVSCGCQKKDNGRKQFTIHGMRESPEYVSWSMMKQRCLNPNFPKYETHGARGITICEQWVNSFEQFYKDMGPRPAGTSLERRDNDGNYEPGNCTWGTKSEQQLNKRSTVRYKFKGQMYTVTELARIRGVTHSSMQERLRKFAVLHAVLG